MHSTGNSKQAVDNLIRQENDKEVNYPLSSFVLLIKSVALSKVISSGFFSLLLQILGESLIGHSFLLPF